MIVEVCANGFESALIAEKAGAHRIELCSELSVGGRTPSMNLLRKVLAEVTLPVYVLIRPRSGNFNYSSVELEGMLKDIQQCKDLGASGIVSGALTPAKEIDLKATQQLLVASEGMDFTFHRAFDEVPFPKQALNQLIALHIPRVLTSGQETTAANGLPLLRELQDSAGKHIEIMPGAGIGSKNVMLFKEAGLQSLHLSATMGNPNGVSEEAEIKKVLQLIQD